MQSRSRYLSFEIGLFLILLMVVAVGCKGGVQEKPAPNVTISHPQQQEVQEWDEYSGRLESPQVVNVAARVTGTIVEAKFKEGSLVKQGDLLYVIDDRQFKAEFASKEAAVAKAQALFIKSEVKLKRYQRVHGTGAVSAEDYDQATAEMRQAESELASAKADLNIAQLNLEWTRVRAPIGGSVSRKLVSEGNNVIGGSGQMTQLTTITSIDPLYAYVSVPEASFHKYQFGIVDDKASEAVNLSCEYVLENDADYRKDCLIDFVDSKVNTNTGTVQIRGVIPNPYGRLKTGMFLRMRIPSSLPYKAILVPDIAIGSDQNSHYLLLVNDSGVVESRAVKLGSAFGKLRAISEGLRLEDRVIIAGLQSARAGIKVNASEAPNGISTPFSSESKK